MRRSPRPEFSRIAHPDKLPRSAQQQLSRPLPYSAQPKPTQQTSRPLQPGENRVETSGTWGSPYKMGSQPTRQLGPTLMKFQTEDTRGLREAPPIYHNAAQKKPVP